MKEFRKFELKTFPSRGYKLTPIELKDLIPFEVKRVYYITDFEAGGKTGEHCHKIEEEVFILAQGSATAVIDRGKGLEEIKLSAPSDAIYVPNFIWHGFKDASSDCVILALSSTNYSSNREDYIEDYEEFRRASPYYRA
ncbi:FdtA/QdtA family cupin domain-containing protein [Candidatus Uhrbacteria bacterium]|nr:FdtA/QdtA family cupin domain-containing protein [Candidatus Uhrbacteria bacterium]